jgi:hypothetical protein
MQFDQILDNGQSDAKPTLGTSGGAVGLLEKLKHLRQFVRRYADSGIFDPDDEVAALMSRRKPDMSAVFTVFRGVVQKIDDDLLKTGRVGVDLEVTPVNRHGERMLSLFDQCLHRLGRTVQDRRGLKDFAAKLDLAQIDAGNVEQIVDKA